MAGNRISVLIEATVDGANRSLASFRKSIDDADGATGKFKAGAASAGASLKANLIPIAGAAGLAIASMAAKSIQAASDLSESTNAVNKSYGEASAAVLDLGENAAESMGLSKSAFNDAAVAFSGFTEKINGGKNEAATLETLTQRAADFASVMNIDVAEAATTFRSALSGEQEPIKKFGIDMSAAAVEAYALANGLVETKGEMTEAIKVQARYGLLLQETSNVAGDFADTSDGLANSQRILSAQVTNLQANIGEHLVPALAQAVNNASNLIGVLEDLGAVDLAFRFKDATDPIQNVSRLMGVATGEADLFGRKVHNVTDAQLDFIKAGGDVQTALSGQVNIMTDAEIAAGRLAATTEVETAATVEATAATEDRITAIREQTAAQNEQTNALLGAINTDLGYRNQVADTSATIAASNMIQADAKRTTDEHAQAARDAEAAVYAQADAAVALAEDQATASGATLTAEEKANLYKLELQRLAGQLTGPTLEAVNSHIAALGRIPRSITTSVKFGSLGGSDYTQPGFGTGKAAGGSVSPNTMYPVGEGGRPELFEQNGVQYLIPGDRGQVTPATGGGGSGAPITLIIEGYPFRAIIADHEAAQVAQLRAGMR